MKIASFFSGCGGLDLGFRQAGFDVVWANDMDQAVHETYQSNHPGTILCKSDIRTLEVSDIPDCDGFIGGPPCQPWSEGGKQRGLGDERGRLFFDYIRLIKEKKPKFFLIENVKGIVCGMHLYVFLSFLSTLEKIGYTVSYALLNAADFRIPQDRYRVFVVGFLKEMESCFRFPELLQEARVTLRQAIGDINEMPRSYIREEVVPTYGKWLNHDVYVGPFDSKFMARNRVRTWDEVSFTIQAQARNCPLHPQAPPMEYVAPDRRIFAPGYEHLYRRLSIRECARIQSFPDHFRFIYGNVKDGYKMVGNAVPPRLAKILALSIMEALEVMPANVNESILIGYYKGEEHLRLILQNKLYYVRAGARQGALEMPAGTHPKYLLLHHRKERRLYKLASAPPFAMQASDLVQKGFSPSGDEYYVFQLENAEQINISGLDLSSMRVEDACRSMAPRIADLSNFL